MARLIDKLFAPVDAASLGAFRFLFGALMTYESLRYFARKGIAETYLAPPFLFPYEAAPFVAPWPGDGLYLHFALMAMAAVGIALGLFYRFSAGLFLVTYLYVFLLDKAQYNNHYYLIVLLALLLLLAPAQRWMSLDQWRRPQPETVPYWNLLALQAQIFIVFFYAGVAKLSWDWLGGEPMRTWLAPKVAVPVVGPWLASETAAYFFSYAGLIFDLLVGFLLLSRRTLPLALAGLLVFNLTNHWLFRIGVFPFLVLATAVLFEAPDFPRRLLRRSPPAPSLAATPPARRAPVLLFLGLYFALQILLPLRHFLYGGSVSWHEQAHRFSWHMKLRSKHGWVRFQVTDPRTGETWQVDPEEELSHRQRRRMSGTPDMIVQYAHHLRERFQARGVPDPIVRAESWVSLNRRPPQRIVDPEVDLGKVPIELFASSSWIVPLDESARPSAIGVGEFNVLALPLAD